MSEPESPARGIALGRNHELQISADGCELVLRQGESRLLKLVLTEKGPELHFDAPQLAIRNTGALSLEAGEIHLRSKGDLVQEIGGDLVQQVGRNQKVAVAGDSFHSAQATRLEARTGSLALQANDDLALNGLRVLHNVPSEEELRQKYAAVRTFADLLSCPAFDPSSPRRLDWGQPLEDEDVAWNS